MVKSLLGVVEPNYHLSFGSASLLETISPPRKPFWLPFASPRGLCIPSAHHALGQRDTLLPRVPCFLLGTSSLSRSLSSPHLAILALLVREGGGAGVGSGKKARCTRLGHDMEALCLVLLGAITPQHHTHMMGGSSGRRMGLLPSRPALKAAPLNYDDLAWGRRLKWGGYYDRESGMWEITKS